MSRLVLKRLSGMAKELCSGIYFYQAKFGEHYSQLKKAVLIK